PSHGDSNDMAKDKETLLAAGQIRLYGRVMLDLKLVPDVHRSDPGESIGDGNRSLEQQLEHEGAKFARIYGFVYEGTYYTLPKPAVFLVHGDGAKAHYSGGGAADLALPPDIKWWGYDRWDHGVRLDVNTGPYYEILLNANIDEQGLQSHYSGKLVAGRRGGLVD
ncbi:MAG: hypothetical protein KDC48_22895, partial [Planctomycetes bacterium]|nr:hypothetical protein [Planctomycetota bacterium]